MGFYIIFKETPYTCMHVSSQDFTDNLNLYMYMYANKHAMGLPPTLGCRNNKKCVIYRVHVEGRSGGDFCYIYLVGGKLQLVPPWVFLLPASILMLMG